MDYSVQHNKALLRLPVLKDFLSLLPGFNNWLDAEIEQPETKAVEYISKSQQVFRSSEIFYQ